MPLYEYECLKCGRRTERIESHKGPHLKRCPHCKGKVERVIAPPAIQFKGSGWYVTDYASKSPPEASSGQASDGDKAEKPGSKKADETKTAKEAAPAKEKSAKKD